MTEKIIKSESINEEDAYDGTPAEVKKLKAKEKEEKSQNTQNKKNFNTELL